MFQSPEKFAERESCLRHYYSTVLTLPPGQSGPGPFVFRNPPPAPSLQEGAAQ